MDDPPRLSLGKLGPGSGGPGNERGPGGTGADRGTTEAPNLLDEVAEGGAGCLAVYLTGLYRTADFRGGADGALSEPWVFQRRRVRRLQVHRAGQLQPNVSRSFVPQKHWGNSCLRRLLGPGTVCY